MSTEKVIPTAWIVAYGRTFSDIPFSKEIFEELELIRKSKGEVVPEELKNTTLAPTFEARYKLTNKLLKENKATQILEVASGLSPRGLEMTENRSLKYAELDFGEIIKEKMAMIEKIYKRLNKGLPTNLFFEEGNALILSDLIRACGHFDENEPIAVVNEGLMRYLTFEQKAVYAKNVRKLLERFGGVWITCDISLNKGIAYKKLGLKSMGGAVSRMTGINIEENLFRDIKQAWKFFEDLGFKIESHSFMEIEKDLVSLSALKMNHEQIEGIMGHNVVFVMAVK